MPDVGQGNYKALGSKVHTHLKLEDTAQACTALWCKKCNRNRNCTSNTYLGVLVTVEDGGEDVSLDAHGLHHKNAWKKGVLHLLTL